MITIAGLLAIKSIPVAQFPDIVPPQVSVTARYQGASAEIVEQTIAQLIESQVNGVDNMLYMKSSSGNDGSYSLAVVLQGRARTPTSIRSTFSTAFSSPSRNCRRRCSAPA